MRSATLAALGLVSALALPASAGPGVATTGPFAGTVTQGQTQTHSYNNNPSNQNCLQYAVWYTVSLAHVPATDRLTLSVDGAYTATSSGGGTAVTFQRGPCTAFTISVTGTSVADSATYAVTVSSGLLGGIGGGWS